MKMLLAVALASASLAAIAAEPPTPPAAGARLSPPKLTLSIKPAQDGTYLVTGTFSDVGSGKVVSNPSMVVKPGTWATVEITGNASQTATQLAVSVAPNGRGAAYFAESRLPDGGSIRRAARSSLHPEWPIAD